MALYLNNMFENMARQFRTTTTDSRFQADFVMAANNALDKLSFGAELDTALTHIAGYNDSVSGLDVDDQSILARIVAFELMMMGQKHVRGDTAYRELKTEADEAIGEFMVKKSRDDQADVADNLSGEDASIIGLGDVTEATSTGTDTMNT
jgi:hypothetical protein